MTSRSVMPSWSAWVRSMSTLNSRIVGRLLQPHVGEARDRASCARISSVGIGLVRRRGSGPATCTSIGRRRAEVEDLADDVGRQEGEGRAGEQLRQALRAAPSRSRAVGRWSSVEADVDVAVLRADAAGVGVGAVDAADRQADVVDDRRQLGPAGWSGGSPASTWSNSAAVSSIRVPTGRAHVQGHLAGIDRREEVARPGTAASRNDSQRRRPGSRRRTAAGVSSASASRPR